MITLPTPGSGDFLNQQITRSSNTFGIPLPQADAYIIAQSDPKNLTTTIDLGAGRRI